VGQARPRRNCREEIATGAKRREFTHDTRRKREKPQRYRTFHGYRKPGNRAGNSAVRKGKKRGDPR